MTSPRAQVVIVGGGISALAAAYQLTGGATPTGTDGPCVTIVERDARLGGKVASTTVAGHVVDGAADGVLARRPEATTLVTELGHDDRLRPVATSGVSVFARGRLRPLPAHLQLGVPTSWSSLRRSGVLSPAGLARALVDVVAPRPAAPVDGDDAAIGALVGAKLGDEVVRALVDPMLGGIYAGRVRELGAASVFPGLLTAASGRGSLMHALRDAAGSAATGPSSTAPAFVSLTGGMHSLPGLLADELVGRGVEIRTGCAVHALRPADPPGPSWSVETDGGALAADGVVVCTPAAATAPLLRPLAPDAAARLDGITYSSVAVVTFSFPEDQLRLPATGTGVLVPAGSIHDRGALRGERWLTTALTFLDRKWPDAHRPGELLVRASAGRIDDDRLATMTDAELVRVVSIELDELLGSTPAPRDVSVTHWPESLAQYTVHHPARVAAIRADVATRPGIELAGATYDGVGIPACIGSGRAAADRLLAELTAD